MDYIGHIKSEQVIQIQNKSHAVSVGHEEGRGREREGEGGWF